MPTQLTANFNLDEFIRSEKATSLGILEQFNPSQNVVANIKALAIQLQKARDIYGKAMIFTSGYRCTRLNKAVGGVADSAHVTGKAVDIVYRSEADAKQLIDSLISAGFKRIGLGGGFIHVDIDNTKPTPACWLYGSKTPVWLAKCEKDIEARIK